MKRREILKGTGAVLASAGLAPAVLRASTKKFRWRLVMVIPKTLPIWGPGVVEFAKSVELMTDGKLRIQVYGAGELVPALQTFDAVKGGSVQMAHSAAYYWIGKLPAAAFFTSVPFGLNALGMKSWLEQGGQELWDELYSSSGVIALPAGNTGMQMGGWFNKEINRPDDFKGLKMRIPGLGGKVIQKLGGTPMLVAGGEIYTNLSTGVIDATEWVGPYHDYTMGFHKAAKYYYYPGWHEPGPLLELMINKKAWQTLPKEYQAVVHQAARALDQKMHNEWLAKDSEYLEKIRSETNVKIVAFPNEVLKRLKKHSYEVRQEVAQSSPLAHKIAESYNNYQKKYDALQTVTEKAYLSAKTL